MIKFIMNLTKTKKGQILLIAVMLMATVVTVFLAVLFKSTNESRTAKIEEESQRALAAAEAALESALQTNQSVTLGQGQLSDLTGITGVATVEDLVTNTFVVPAVKKDSSYTFYLADYDPVSKRFTGSSLNQDITVCFDSANPNNPAIEMTLVKTDSVRKYVIDPDNVITNSYQTGGTCPADSSLEYSYTIPGTEILSDSRLLLVRVFFSDSKLILTRSSNLPIQGRTAFANVTTDTGVTKKVNLFQSYPQLPAEFYTTSFGNMNDFMGPTPTNTPTPTP